MIYTNELHFTITYPLLKRQYQMCSKLHQPPWKKRKWIYVWDKLGACFNKQKGRKSSHSQFSTQTYLMNKMSAYEAATSWSRGIPRKNLRSLIKSYFFPSYLIVLLNASKSLSKVRSFDIKWIKYGPVRQIHPNTGEYLVFFSKHQSNCIC